MSTTEETTTTSKPEIIEEIKSETPVIVPEITEEPEEPITYFDCVNCQLHERYEYFGQEPPFARKLKLLEPSYVIEDPFQPPKRGEILILGAHCKLCSKSVCKSVNCSFYFDGTLCIHCAKSVEKEFPKVLRERLNKIIV